MTGSSRGIGRATAIQLGQEVAKNGLVAMTKAFASAICFLASDDACYITGEVLIVDGG